MESIFSIISWGIMIAFLWFIASRAHIMQNERIAEREEIRKRVLERREKEKQEKEKEEKQEEKQ